MLYSQLNNLFFSLCFQQTKARRADNEDQDEEDDGQAQEAQDILDQINESKVQNFKHCSQHFIWTNCTLPLWWAMCRFCLSRNSIFDNVIFSLPFIIIHYDTGILIISQEQNGGRIEDQFVNRFVRDRLKSMPCQNQGFILDGYPKSTDQAKEVFACKTSLFLVIFIWIE